jgi:hypothetical protein
MPTNNGVGDLPEEGIHFIEAVTAHFGRPEAVIFHNKRKSGFMPKTFDDTNRGVLFREENMPFNDEIEF